MAKDDNDGFNPRSWQDGNPENWFAPRGIPVQNSPDLERVLNLPRRAPVTEGSATAEALIELGMRKYGRVRTTPCRCAEIQPPPPPGQPPAPCVCRLLWVQAWILHEISVANGCIGNAAVGIGKCTRSSVEVFDYKLGRRRSVAESGELQVASFDKELHVRTATAFSSGRKECVDVRLRDGTSIEVSTDHPILTGRGWIDAANLTSDDFVARAIELPEPDRCTKASDEEVAFVAYMLSDGGCSKSTLSFTNATPSVIADWWRCSEALGYGVTELEKRSKARQFNLRTGRSGQPLARKRWDLYGLAKDKRAHADIWGLPRQQVALFLNRFWACDGHVAKKHLELTLASEKLIDDVRFLLTRLGVVSSKSYKVASYSKDGVRRDFDAWRIHVSGGAALQFLDEVGDVLGKEDACRELRAHLSSLKRNPNTDVVPVSVTEINEILDELFPTVPPPCGTLSGYRRGCRCRPCTDTVLADNRERITRRENGDTSRRARAKHTPRTEVTDFLHPTSGQFISRPKFIEFCHRWGYTGKYAHLATTDVRWERVESVTPQGVHDVYDLTVPGTHNFVANGVVIHNTLCDILSPLAFRDCQLALLLAPANLLDQLEVQYQLIAEHFYVPGIVIHLPGRKTWSRAPERMLDGRMTPVLHVISYNKLSDTENSTWLEQLRPDVIIADEGDALSDRSSARVLRLMRFYQMFGHITRFAVWTGSLTNNKIAEFAHLALIALREGSPLPLVKESVDEWGRAVDADPTSPPGALRRFLEPHESDKEIRIAFRRRLAETKGFVLVQGTQKIIAPSGIEVDNRIRERHIDVIPDIVNTALGFVRRSIRPDTLGGAEDDEVLVEEVEKIRCAREVATGCYYRYHFPRGEPKPLVKEWYAARKLFRHEQRIQILKGMPFLDSAKLTENAARRHWGELPLVDDRGRELPTWASEHWPRWAKVKDLVEPKQMAVRLHPFLVEDAAEWGHTNTGVGNSGIIWIQMREFGFWLNEISGLPIYGEGTGKTIVQERGDRSIIASLKSHGRGRDRLQFAFSKQLVANAPASSRMWQQLLGRLHRRGQRSEQVITDVYTHTDEVKRSVQSALKSCKYVEQTMGEGQKLLNGWEGEIDDE